MDPEVPGWAGGDAEPRALRPLADDQTVAIDGGGRARAASGLDLSARLPESRYQLGEHVASGGQGDVYRVFDRALRRTMVMKMLGTDRLADPVALARFFQEARVTAQLQHPSIVPVHEIGTLSDGRPYYTMAEVRGRTLTAVIEAVHLASTQQWSEEPGGFGFARLVDVFRRVCEAVAYAHSRGVMHRDLKPQNVMVGEFGEVLVLDWGLARLRGAHGHDTAPAALESLEGAVVSAAGAIAGTMGYMAPEQARGEVVGPAADVYSLGMILREVLVGARPGIPEMIGIPIEIALAANRPVAEELVAICHRALAIELADRYADAGELARAVTDFLVGARKRERAHALLDEACSRMPGITELRDRAEQLEREARVVLDPLPPSAAVAAKAPGWALEDRARELRVEAELATHEMTRLVESSLIEFELPAAHALFADHYRALHEAAERTGDPLARKLEVQLRVHDHGQHAAYLAGTGALTLHTEPPAEVELRRYQLRDRCLVDEHVAQLGRAPVRALELPHGSYLLILRAEGCHDVRYPVAIGRQEHWDPRRPGSSEPHPVVLPPLGAIGAGERYVPAGPFLCGGDPLAAGEVMKRQQVWLDAFVMRRHPITNRELLEMANALIDDGLESVALDVVPRHRGTSAGDAGPLVWSRDAHGHFTLGHDDGGLAWEPDLPAFMVTWSGAQTYAAWLARRTGLAYRLPGELEMEKAARGVDGRCFPWGDFFDPTWTCMRLSRDGALRPAPVDDYPADDSPYQVRGLAGNVVEWCADEYRREGPPILDGRYVPPLGLGADAPACERTLRGGCFFFDSFLLRAATRHSTPSVVRDVSLGFRLARSYPG